VYAYAGILKTLLAAPDVAERDLVPGVVFDAESIAQWRGHDLDLFPENRRLRSHAQRIADGVRLSGHFEEERRIDNLSSGDPQFWVPLASAGVADERFPVDLAAFPVVEITYRCWTDNAYPAWLWAYPGGYGLDWLPLARRWRTVARYMPLGGCPEAIDAVVLRLYSTSRTTESVDFQSVRFRALTAAEARLKEVAPPPNYAPLQPAHAGQRLRRPSASTGH